MRIVTGQSIHLRPHAHQDGAVIRVENNTWRISCCSAEATSIAGLGEIRCTGVPKPSKAVLSEAASGIEMSI